MRKMLLTRSVLRAAQRAAPVSRSAPPLARALATNVSTSLVAPEKAAKEVSVGEYERFDPSKWLSAESAPQVRAELARIRQAEDEAIDAVTGEVPDIDWGMWKKSIAYPGLVDELKAAYESVPVPNFDKERERMQAEVNAAFEPLLAKLAKHAKDAEASSKEFKIRLEEISHLEKNLADMPIDDFLEKYPAVRKSIEDDVKNNKWFV